MLIKIKMRTIEVSESDIWGRVDIGLTPMVDKHHGLVLPHQQSTAIINGLASLSIWSQFGHSWKLTLKLTLFAREIVVHESVSKQSFHGIKIDTALLFLLKNKQEYFLISL